LAAVCNRLNQHSRQTPTFNTPRLVYALPETVGVKPAPPSVLGFVPWSSPNSLLWGQLAIRLGVGCCTTSVSRWYPCLKPGVSVSMSVAGSFTYGDARRGRVELDVLASEVDDLASKGNKDARRGRKPKGQT
jgi:hypothetical protein